MERRIAQVPHQLVIFPNGTASIRPSASDEPMHSRIGPWAEAQLLYIGQSRLGERLRAPGRTEPLVLYDVGMGIAANALAAIHCAASIHAPERRALRIVSFETQLEGLGIAMENPGHFPFLSGFEGALRELLSEGRWKGGGIEWELRGGDFRAQTLGSPEPELIFYDFYSPRSVNAALWGHESFARLWKACAERRAEGIPVTLYTYSSATAVRSALFLAGFHVGRGASTGLKQETTVASTLREDLQDPLGPEWLAKLRRSSKPLPRDWPASRSEEALEILRQRVGTLLSNGFDADLNQKVGTTF